MEKLDSRKQNKDNISNTSKCPEFCLFFGDIILNSIQLASTHKGEMQPMMQVLLF
jgi:hypothetical protein